MLSEPKNSKTDGYALFFTTPPTCFPWSAFSCVATTWNMIHRKRRNPVWYSTMKRMRLLRWEVSTGTFYSAALWWSLSRDVKQDSCGKVSILLHVISDHLSDTKKEDVLEWELKKNTYSIWTWGFWEWSNIFCTETGELMWLWKLCALKALLTCHLFFQGRKPLLQLLPN